MWDSTVFWIHLDCGFAEKIWTLQNTLQTPDFGNLEFVKHLAQFKFWRDLNVSFAKKIWILWSVLQTPNFAITGVAEGVQNWFDDLRKTSTTQLLAWPKFGNIRLQPQMAKFLVWPRTDWLDRFHQPWNIQILEMCGLFKYKCLSVSIFRSLSCAKTVCSRLMKRSDV